MHTTSRCGFAAALAASLIFVGTAHGQSSSVLVNKIAGNGGRPVGFDPQDDPAVGLYEVSLFATRPPPPATFQKHDHIEIIIRETSTVRASQDIRTEKSSEFDAEIVDFPQITLNDLADFVLKRSENRLSPKLDVSSSREFEGDGAYSRRDDFSARITAEVIDVLPNGYLVLESRTFIKTDGEESMISVSGVCDPERVSPARTILSNQLFGLTVVKTHNGELPESSEKGIFTRAMETIFAF